MTDTTPQLSSTRTAVVTDADTATRFGTAFPPAASTPFVLGLAEVACHDAVRSLLPDGRITVGTSAQIEHVAPTPVGDLLTAQATLRQRDGSRLEFEVEVRDSRAVVARIHHSRAIVDPQRIAERLER